MGQSLFLRPDMASLTTRSVNFPGQIYENLGIVMLAGFVHGITGFGGAMVMAPPLSYLIGPAPTVVIALTLETTAAAVVFPDVLSKVRWPTLGYLIIPDCLTVPIGGHLLVTPVMIKMVGPAGLEPATRRL